MSPRKVTKRPHAAADVGPDRHTTDRPANVDGMTLGARLRAARARRRLTLRTVAERSGLSRGFISQVELGQVSPSFASLSKIADALGEHLTGRST